MAKGTALDARPPRPGVPFRAGRFCKNFPEKPTRIVCYASELTGLGLEQDISCKLWEKESSNTSTTNGGLGDGHSIVSFQYNTTDIIRNHSNLKIILPTILQVMLQKAYFHIVFGITVTDDEKRGGFPLPRSHVATPTRITRNRLPTPKRICLLLLAHL